MNKAWGPKPNIWKDWKNVGARQPYAVVRYLFDKWTLFIVVALVVVLFEKVQRKAIIQVWYKIPLWVDYGPNVYRDGI